MKLLTAEEIKSIKVEERFVLKIEKICQAFTQGMADLTYNKGYRCQYLTKSERVAYSLGWNKVSATFSNIKV
jgi:hypothetical protein